MFNYNAISLPIFTIVCILFFKLKNSWCTILCKLQVYRQGYQVVSHFLLQGIFSAQGLNPGLLHCRQILYCLSLQGSPQVHNLVSHHLLKDIFPFIGTLKYWLYFPSHIVQYVPVAYNIHHSLYFLVSYLYIAPPLFPLLTGNTSLFSISVSLLLLLYSLVCCIFQTSHTSDTTQYFSFSSWLISLSIVHSKSIHIAASGKISFFLLAE